MFWSYVLYGMKLATLFAFPVLAIIFIHGAWWGFRNIKEGIECRKEFPDQLPLGMKWATISLTGIILLITLAYFLPNVFANSIATSITYIACMFSLWLLHRIAAKDSQ